MDLIAGPACREPVQEKDAPNYHLVIKHPVDIQTMRNKVRSR